VRPSQIRELGVSFADCQQMQASHRSRVVSLKADLCLLANRYPHISFLSAAVRELQWLEQNQLTAELQCVQKHSEDVLDLLSRHTR
jgi:hypothetical protein